MTSRADRKRKGPKSPDQIQAERLAQRGRDLAAVNIPPELAALPNGNDIDVNHAERDKIDGARRMDAFLALRDKMEAGAYDAARRLENDIALRYGEADRGQPGERVDSGVGGPGCTDAMVDAGARVDGVLKRMGGRDAWLLAELIRPSITRTGGWRGVVSYVTGEENPVAQGAVVRSACANLSLAYRAWDDLSRIAA